MSGKQKQKMKGFENNRGPKRDKNKLAGYLSLANKVIWSLAVLAGTYFVFSINDISVKGFILEDLKTQARNLNGDNNSTELQIMALESYDNIKARAISLNMVKVDKIEYLTVSNNAMAKK